MARARCNARLTAGWLSNSRDAAAVTLFSSAIAANVIRRFKSTWRSFSRRMVVMFIMHEAHFTTHASLKVQVEQGEYMRQGTDLRNKRVVVLGGSSGIGFAVAEQA